MATDLLEQNGTKIKELTLIPSGGGVFEVTINGSLVFSKKATGRFPELDEIVSKI